MSSLCEENRKDPISLGDNILPARVVSGISCEYQYLIGIWISDMSKTDSQVNLEFGASAKVAVDIKTEIPSESSGRLLDAITDLIRPFSERRGLQADRLRLEREEVLFEIALRARRRIELEQSAIRPIPNKLLVPLLEKASLEDISDKKLIEMWSNLLATALTQKVEMLNQYVTILSGLTGEQARIFESIISASLPTTGERLKTGNFIDQYYYLNQTGLPSTVRQLENIRDAKSFATKLFQEIDTLGVAVDTINVFDNKNPKNDISLADHDRGLYSDKLFLEFENLCRLGLLEHVEIKSMSLGRFSFDVFYYLVTPVGIDLYACCNPNTLIREM